jgi:spore germination protein GerM
MLMGIALTLILRGIVHVFVDVFHRERGSHSERRSRQFKSAALAELNTQGNALNELNTHGYGTYLYGVNSARRDSW